MGSLKVVSKIGKIQNADERIFQFLSDFRNFDRLIPPDVEGWESDANSCHFRLKGQAIELHIVERIPFKTIKIQSDDGSAFPFTFWIQLISASAYDTRVRLTIHADVNMMMRVVMKKQLKKGLDQLVNQLAIIPYP
ncbi:MAG: polyketide cyclase [Bacteroidales bacterium]|jgi:carbon monoxide dehydrogenase subunit G|nr:polyketide cyclase [Bacteroidales bacterium]